MKYIFVILKAQQLQQSLHKLITSLECTLVSRGQQLCLTLLQIKPYVNLM